MVSKVESQLPLGSNSEVEFYLYPRFREDINRKKTFSFGHCPNEGGVYPYPNFLALFQEVHFGSIKRVYFFKNANELNF